jgi:phenylacetic acid degradation protein
MPSYAIDGIVPVVDPSSFVHPTASLIGDVIIGPGCYIGPGASLRGDFGRIELGEGSNVQDNCVLHTRPGGDTLVGPGGHLGHGAILHGSTLAAEVLVGINAILMDGVSVGAESIVAPMASLRPGLVVPARSIVAGNPARVVRAVEARDLLGKRSATQFYRRLAERCLATLRETPPLARADAARLAERYAGPTETD